MVMTSHHGVILFMQLRIRGSQCSIQGRAPKDLTLLPTELPSSGTGKLQLQWGPQSCPSPSSALTHSPSGTRQGCLLQASLVTAQCRAGYVLSRVWPEKPGSTSWREEPGTTVPRGHFICYLNHFHFLQIMKARGLYVFTEMDYHVIRVYSI